MDTDADPRTDAMPATPRSAAASLWAKTSSRCHIAGGYPLAAHLLDTAAAARVITAAWIAAPLRERLARSADSWQSWADETTLIAAWHDIGKATGGFQARSPDQPRWLRPGADLSSELHQTQSMRLVHDHLNGCDSRATWRVAQIVSGHHGIVAARDPALEIFGGAALVDHSDTPNELIEARRWLMRTVAQASGGAAGERSDLVSETVSLAVATTANWLASAQRFIAAQTARHGGTAAACSDPAGWYATALEVALETLDSLGLGPAPYTPAAAGSVLTQHLTPLQADIAARHGAAMYGITIIKAHPAQGGPVAALLAADSYAAARGAAGWYFASRSGSDLSETLARAAEASRGELRSGLDAQLPRQEFDSAETAARSWLAGPDSALLAPFGAGSFSDLIEAVLRSEHSAVRLFAAGRRPVIVADPGALSAAEAAALPRLVSWLAAMRAPVIISVPALDAGLEQAVVRAYQAGCGTSDSAPQHSPRPGWRRWAPQRGAASGGADLDGAHPPIRVSLTGTASAALYEQIASAAAGDARSGAAAALSSVDAARAVYNQAIAAAADPAAVILAHPQMRRRDLAAARRAAADAAAQRRPFLVVCADPALVDVAGGAVSAVHSDPAAADEMLSRVWHLTGPRGGSLTVWWPRTRSGGPTFVSAEHDRFALMHTRRMLEQTTVIASAAQGEAFAAAPAARWGPFDAHRLVPPPSDPAMDLHLMTAPGAAAKIARDLGLRACSVLPAWRDADTGVWLYDSADGPVPMPDDPPPDSERHIWEACVPVATAAATLAALTPARSLVAARPTAWGHSPLRDVLVLDIAQHHPRVALCEHLGLAVDPSAASRRCAVCSSG